MTETISKDYMKLTKRGKNENDRRVNRDWGNGNGQESDRRMEPVTSRRGEREGERWRERGKIALWGWLEEKRRDDGRGELEADSNGYNHSATRHHFFFDFTLFFLLIFLFCFTRINHGYINHILIQLIYFRSFKIISELLLIYLYF